MLISFPTMALSIKKPHYYFPIFENTDKNTSYHSIIDVLTSSNYKAILTANTPIYQDTLHDFWANTEIQPQKKCLMLSLPKSEVHLLQFPHLPSQGKTSFEKQELHTKFTGRGCEG
ncbi:hypothetical protein Hanom_Chr10g00929301 [Helianthus anomalus]